MSSPTSGPREPHQLLSRHEQNAADLSNLGRSPGDNQAYDHLGMKGELAITFHRSPQVPDDPVSRRQEIHELGANSTVSCSLLFAEIEGGEVKRMPCA